MDTLDWGGVQTLLLVLAQRAPRLGISLDVIALGGASTDRYVRDLAAHGARVFEIAPGRARQIGRLAGLVSLFRANRPDIVHAHLPVANVVGALAARCAGVPMIGSLHHREPPDGRRNLLRERAEGLALRTMARVVLACGPAVAAANRARLGRVPIEVLANPAPCVPASEHDAPALRHSLVGAAEGPVAIAVGRLSPEKAHDALISAAAALRLRHPGFRLLIVGDGPLAGALRHRVHASGLDRHVLFLGAREDAARLLAAADLYLSASRREGLSIALLEAMAQGLPVIASAAGDVGSLVPSGAIDIVASDDPLALARAVSRLAADPARRGAMGEAGRRWVALRHDPDAWATGVGALYRRTARPRSPAIFQPARAA